MFEVPIQAAVGKKIIARETLSAYRADVTAGLYGGHVERKMKANAFFACVKLTTDRNVFRCWSGRRRARQG